MLPTVTHIASEHDQAARLQQDRNFLLRFDVHEVHDTGRAEAERRDGIGKAWYTIDMRRDTLAGLVFVDNDLIGRLGKKTVGTQPVAV